MLENKYFISYQLDIIDGTLAAIQIHSKIITLNLNELEEDIIWSKLDLPDNYIDKRLLLIQKL